MIKFSLCLSSFPHNKKNESTKARITLNTEKMEKFKYSYLYSTAQKKTVTWFCSNKVPKSLCVIANDSVGGVIQNENINYMDYY